MFARNQLSPSAGPMLLWAVLLTGGAGLVACSVSPEGDDRAGSPGSDDGGASGDGDGDAMTDEDPASGGGTGDGLGGGTGLGGSDGGDGDGDVDEPLGTCEAILAEQGFCNTLGDVTYETPGTLEAGCHSFGALEVGSSVIVKNDPFEGPTVIVADTINIAEAGVLDGSLRGYGSGLGPGAGVGAAPYGSGAGHGGKGGDRAGELGGETYGDPLYPITAGSGGGLGGAGGGAILLCARESITIDGVVAVNGGPATAAGGGSGGSILVLSPLVAGTGTVEAKGGLAASSICGGTGASGGGGRIAVLTDDDQFTTVGSGMGTVDVTAPVVSCSHGSNGTQYVGSFPE